MATPRKVEEPEGPPWRGRPSAGNDTGLAMTMGHNLALGRAPASKSTSSLHPWDNKDYSLAERKQSGDFDEADLEKVSSLRSRGQ